MLRAMKLTILLFLALALAPAAFADKCEAKPASTKAGALISGEITYVMDGDSLCIGMAGDQASWVEVRLVDFSALELTEPGGAKGRDTARQILMGKQAVCTVTRGTGGRTTTYDRVLATCSVGGRSVAQILLDAGVPEGGR
jgi:endonuclease YncB( thermonuclease family)